MSSCGELSGTQYYTCADTVVQNAIFTPLFAGLMGWDASINPKHIGWLRKAGQLVYYKTDWFASEHLLYHFGLSIGDTCRVVRNYTSIGSGSVSLRYPLFEVVQHDSILVDGIMVQRWVLTGDDPDLGNELWLEGIGSLRGPVDVKYCPEEGQEANLICMRTPQNFFYDSNVGWICALLSHLDCGISLNATPVIAQKTSLFPNPFMEFTNVSIPYQADLKVKLCNSLGQTYHPTFAANSEGITLKRGSLPAGWYMLEIHTDQKIIYRCKVIAE
jgi:hypothetical protein